MKGRTKKRVEKAGEMSKRKKENRIKKERNQIKISRSKKGEKRKGDEREE